MHAQPVLLHTLCHTNTAAIAIDHTRIQSSIRRRPILLLMTRLVLGHWLIRRIALQRSRAGAAALLLQFVQRLARQRAALRGDGARLALLSLELLQSPPLLLRSLGGRR